ncbi:MAG: ATP-dependent zinc metalloprotease FtsH [Patescibacteria group bacterium]|nr:ATP-dependent zinc metalloprotease FtsH [Patescibacteria group bacterium]MDE2437998.1 ATP-dependent zinc metalloprotease FtsH [Patescibacteria group bacterium]
MQQPKNGKELFKNIAWAFLTLALLVLIAGELIGFPKSSKQVTLSDIVNDINTGQVTKLSVTGNELDATLKDNTVLVAQKESELGISQTLTNLGVQKDQLQGITIEINNDSGFMFWVGLLVPTVLPALLILFIFWYMFRQAQKNTNQAMFFGRSNIRLFSPGEKDKVTFKNVAGLEESKEELREVVDFLKYPKKYLEMGARIPRGILLVGPPGTGKTLLARAVAGEANVPFFHISGSEFVELFVGVGASRVRDAFSVAKKAAPAIIFIDEIDAIGRERGAGLGGGNDEREQTLNQILVEMDGFDRETQIIVIAATNRPDILDSALLRPGRFDRRVLLDLPDIKEREAILQIHASDKHLDKNVSLRKIAERTPGFSGADLANLINEAALYAARMNRKMLSEADILNSIDKVLLGPERKSRIISPREKQITAYHEAGHALVASVVPEADPVHKVTIIARGRAGGYTLKLPLEETHLKTKKQFLADIAVAIGGYAAEKLIFGDVSTGSSNDLKEASNMARLIVTRYGMSDVFGPITFGKSQDLVFLGREITSEQNYSEKVASEIDDEVQKIMTGAFKVAESIVKKQRKALGLIADSLVQEETLEREAFERLLELGGIAIKKQLTATT